MRHPSKLDAAAIAAILLLAGCASRGRPAGWSAGEHLGVVVATAARVCLSIDAVLAPRTSIRIADPASRRHTEATVSSEERACLPAGSPPERRGYALAFSGTPPRLPLVGVGSVDTARWRDRAPAMAADLDGDGRDEFLRACTSREGVHFTVWRAADMAGARVWHRYHYLGYDVDPTCTPRETAGG